ncbi:chemotaxis protein CheZ [Azospirillaceae bacterium]
MTKVTDFTEEDYNQLQSFVARTPRGRAFLAEHQRRAQIIGTSEVCKMISDLRDAWSKHIEVANASKHIGVLRHELQDMSASISQARREIASLRPKDGGNDRILSATNELDAIVLSTERASFEILNSAERILDLNRRFRESDSPAQLCDDLEGEVMNVFTACSFQDLTGQRTTKVVNALRYIEQRIMSMMKIWEDGAESDAASPQNRTPIPDDIKDTRPDSHLLNGPSDNGIDQSEIDRLLNGGFDPVPAAPPPQPPKQPKQPTPVVEEEPEEALPALDQGAIDALFG